MHLTKSGRLRSWKALDFKKWGLEPRSLTEVYAYGGERIAISVFVCLSVCLSVGQSICLSASSGHW